MSRRDATRILWPDKPRRQRLQVLVLASVAIAMVGVVLLVSDAMFPTALAVPVTAVAAAGCVTIWFLMPLWRRRSLAHARPELDAMRPRGVP
jgi:hypothetical protein